MDNYSVLYVCCGKLLDNEPLEKGWLFKQQAFQPKGSFQAFWKIG
jgi:hypothetical protein